MVKVILSNIYRKRAKKFLYKNPYLLNQYKKSLQLLEKNPYHPSLRLHKLKGRYQDYYSILINMKCRIMSDFIIRDDKVILLDIGNHDFLYR
jgi:mRNA-degrading endonuclease YafQ of YafQ-DinJ toxin-antitoxin module